MKDKELDSILRFMLEINATKSIRRTGWSIGIELLAHAPYNAKQRKRTEDFFATAARKIRNKDLLYVYDRAKAVVLR